MSGLDAGPDKDQISVATQTERSSFCSATDGTQMKHRFVCFWSPPLPKPSTRRTSCQPALRKALHVRLIRGPASDSFLIACVQ